MASSSNNERARRYYATNKERINARRRELYQTKKTPQNVINKKNKRLANLPRLQWPTLKTILPCNYQTLCLLNKPLKQIHPCLIALTPPSHMLSTTFILIKHIKISVQRLINFHPNAHAPFVLNHILGYISAIPTTCIVALDASLKQRFIASHYQTTWTLVLSQLSLHLFHK